MNDSIEAVVARAASGLADGGKTNADERSEHDSDSISSFLSNSSGSSDYYSLSNDEINPNDKPVAIDELKIVDVPKIAVDENAAVANNCAAANSPETNVDAIASPAKSPNRRTKTRSIEIPSPKRSSMNRCERSSDSMLEDALVADKLKRRLASRRLSQVTNRRTIEYTGLSDFIMKSIMEGGSLDAISAVLPTNESLSNVANTAYHACMSGYFSNLKDEIVIQKVKNLFMDSLERMEYQQDEYICKQNKQVEKLFVIEEGMVQFSCGEEVAGTAGVGSILGELSLVYGVPAPSDIKCITPCVILWAMDTLAYRRIQAVVAKESLKSSSSVEVSNGPRESQIQSVRRKCSSFLDLQEENDKSEDMIIPFERLEKVAIVGKGAFGSVYIVENKNSTSDTERYYSLKCMSKSSIVERGNEQRILIEKHALQTCVKSNFIITLFGTYQDQDSIYFLTDFIAGGNLMGHMISRDILPHEECVFFSANIVSGLSFLHSRGFVHRDIKPENCLICKDGYLKLCDLGMAKRLPSTVQLPSGGTEVVTLAFTMCGTPEFIAPEFVLSTGYSKGIDWWALGCIVVEMYSGRSPFEFDGDLKKTFRQVCLIGMGRESFSPPNEMQQPGLEDALDFVQQLLVKASERLGRDSSHRVKDHRYFSQIDFEQLGKKLLKPPYVPKLLHATDASHFNVKPDDDEPVEKYTGSNSIFKNF
jgi:serine/threonine protein kinase